MGRGDVFYFANYRFSFRKLQIFISQTTDFHFVSFHLVSLHFVWQTTVSRDNVHSQKRVSGNRPLSTVSKHLLLGLPPKI